MSASVLARSYDDTPTGQPLLLPSASGSRSSRPASVQRPNAIRTLSSMKGERAKAGAPSASGMRISFATNTSFHEGPLKSRRSSRSSNRSLNLRIVQRSDRPSQVRVKIPKATTATGTRRPSASHDEFLHPRKAAEIARSYGIPKYFLRSDSQHILTDGRMRLFGDSIWKKERAFVEADRQSVESSDVINRLMKSVNKAIATSQKTKNTTNDGDEAAMNLEVISLKSGFDDQPNVTDKPLQRGLSTENLTVDHSSAKPRDRSISQSVTTIGNVNLYDIKTDNSAECTNQYLRPHTVDTSGICLTGYLPKVIYKESEGNTFVKHRENINAVIPSNSAVPIINQGSGNGVRLKQIAAPFRGVSDFTTISDKAKLLDEKYHNVLPRFFPVVSAHRYKQQAVTEKSFQRSKKKTNHHRLVRFADAHTVRFSNESEKSEMDSPLASVVVKRAPVQSVQRALDSHSCLHQLDKNSKSKSKDMPKSDVIEETVEQEDVI